MMQAEAIALCRFYGFTLSSMIGWNPLLGGSRSAYAAVDDGIAQESLLKR